MARGSQVSQVCPMPVCAVFYNLPLPTPYTTVIASMLTALADSMGSGIEQHVCHMLTIMETVLNLVGPCFYHLHKEDNTADLIGLLKEIKEIIM